MRRTNYYSDSEIEFLKQNYHNLGAKKCCKILSRSYLGLKSKANDLGLKVTKETRRLIHQEYLGNPYKLNVNPLRFINVETPEHAYLMGFIWGDGHIEKNSFMTTVLIAKKDADCLHNIFNVTGKWNYREIIRPKNTYSHFCTNNKALHTFFKSLDYHKKSFSSTDRVINHIPEKFQYLWIRGLIDADGCFGKRKVFSITSSYNQDWEFLLKFLSQHSINLHICKATHKIGRSSYIYSSSKSNIHNIHRFVYPNGWDNIGLYRKYQSLEQILKSF